MPEEWEFTPVPADREGGNWIMHIDRPPGMQLTSVTRIDPTSPLIPGEFTLTYGDSTGVLNHDIVDTGVPDALDLNHHIYVKVGSGKREKKDTVSVKGGSGGGQSASSLPRRKKPSILRSTSVFAGQLRHYAHLLRK